jgi:hypothetical protein
MTWGRLLHYTHRPLFWLSTNYECRRGSRVSSVSIVSDYGLDDRAIGVRSPAGALTSVSRPALGPTQPPVKWVPGVLSPGVKRGRGVMLTTHPHLVPRSWKSRSYTPLPPSAFMACRGTALLLRMQENEVRRLICILYALYSTAIADYPDYVCLTVHLRLTSNTETVHWNRPPSSKYFVTVQNHLPT